ncbi:MAG: DUF4468 domain-containing protein [Prevotella sp.]|nr:DUF4468 domain-containing protein [Prevotella sp.]
MEKIIAFTHRHGHNTKRIMRRTAVLITIFLFLSTAIEGGTLPGNEESGTTVTRDRTISTGSKDGKKTGDDTPYLKGAVPEIDGQIVFSDDIEIAGLTALEAYGRAYQFMDSLAGEDVQSGRSTISLTDEENYRIVGSYVERLTFRKQALALDQADFGYIIITDCTDTCVHVSIERLYYDYFVVREKKHLAAEDVISDKIMLSGDGTKLKKYNSRIRRTTVDRMREILSRFRAALQ